MIVEPREVLLRDGTPVTLRSPRGADAQAMLAYVRGLLAESSRNMNHWETGFDQMTEEEEAAILEQYAADAHGFMIAAFMPEGPIVGMIGVTVDGRGRLAHCGTIGMGARAAHHGQGLGQALLEAAIAAADAAGVWNLRLYVRTFNTPAIKLYEKCGFTQMGVLRQMAVVEEGFADEYVYQRLGAGAPAEARA